MNAWAAQPYKYPAGVLAFAVHGIFFALLYFGFAWQNQPPAVMNVTLWKSLPDDAPLVVPPPLEVKPAPPAPPAPTPVEIKKPDIVLPEKKPPVAKPIEKPLPKSIAKSEVRPTLKPVLEPPKIIAPVKPARPTAEELQAGKEQAERAAAVEKMVNEYTAKINNKIRGNIVMPSDVANDASVEFAVTLLPGGRVLDTHRTKSSGNAAYEAAVERAIRKSDPLPLPPDPAMFNRFRELRLKFKPVE